MRMWNVNPKLPCRKHLLGEHVEMHMFAGAINKGKNLDGYINDGLVEIHNISKRHEQLAQEMKARGYQHNSELSAQNWKEPDHEIGHVNVEANLIELASRCIECAERITRMGRHARRERIK